MNSTHLIPQQNLGELDARLARLNKRAEKLGLPVVTTERGPVQEVAYVRSPPIEAVGDSGDVSEVREAPRRWDESMGPLAELETAGRVIYRRFVPVAVTGEAPTLHGWQFVATLQYVESEAGERQTVVRSVPGAGELPLWVRSTTPDRCDHCRTTRRRRDTFIVRKVGESPDGSAYAGMEPGTHLQVGRNCLADFFPGADPHRLAAGLEHLLSCADALADAAGWGEFGQGGCRGVPGGWPVREVLAVSALMVRTYRWVSRAKAAESEERASYGGPLLVEATAGRVQRYLDPPTGHGYDSAEARREWQQWRAEHPVTDADRATAEAALEWARTDLQDRGDAASDYEHNLRVACSMAGCDRRTLGIVASLVQAHRREVERLAPKPQRPPSQHVGALKERILFRATVERVTACEGEFGTTLVHRLVAIGESVGTQVPAGAELTWFCSGEGGLEAGATAWLRATVVKHGNFRGVPQTTVNRAVEVSAAEAQAEADKLARKAARAAKKAAKAGATTQATA